MKILYLYTEVMGYTIATIKVLVDRGSEVHVVHWDKKKKTPYQIPSHRNIYLYPRSMQTLDSLRTLATNLNPDITVISGWQDKAYLGVARQLRKQGKIVVSGFDGQWHGRPRQQLAALLARLGFFSRYYTHAWVAGPYQYEYARKLGFRMQKVVFDLYSADVKMFQSAYQEGLERKTSNYPHRFLFVGRFEPIKGLVTLLRAWEQLGDDRRDWELHMIGNGSLGEKLAQTPGIVVKEFMEPARLAHEVAQAGCFVLPSRGEPWGVVVHEFAAGGLPLIVSDVVGAASTFLVTGLNGYRFKAEHPTELARAMKNIVEQSDTSLSEMGRASYFLSNRITPETSASNLMSVNEEIEKMKSY